MRAIVVEESGSPDVLEIAEVPTPECEQTEVLIKVHAAGVNRADLLQRQGFYPPPPGASDILGLEVSGEVVEVGELVDDFFVGDAVVALLTGGGYAEYVAVDSRLVLPLPDGLTHEQGAGLPEAVATVWSNLFMVAGLQPEESVLIHGGGSGIGTIAIQLAHQAGARVFATVGSSRKGEICTSLGADVVINYNDEDFVAIVSDQTRGEGVDIVLDIVGAAYLERNLAALATDGRLVVIGLQGGTRAEINLGQLLSRRLSVMGTSLRSRPTRDKSLILEQVREVVWPVIENGSVRPVISESYPLAEARLAHESLAAGGPVGKVVLTMGA